MRRCRIIIGLFTLLLVSMLPCAFTIQPVKASETVYIRADGSVEGTDKIQRDGDVYALTGNINNSIVVERDNIVIDGAGYTLQETESYPVQRAGIDLIWGSDNVTIRNTEIRLFSYGIRLKYSHGSTVSGNNVTDSPNSIHLDQSCRNIVSGNYIDGSGSGIILDYSSDNIISGNYINSGGAGIRVQESSSNIISGNHIKDSREGIDFSWASRNIVFGNNITNNGDGIYFDDASDNLAFGNTIEANYLYGIRLSQESSNNSFFHNNFVDNQLGHVNQYYGDRMNVWDDGLPSGGNHWSGHVCTGNPSNGLQPYVMNPNNTDHYPFQDPSGWPPTIVVLSRQNTTYTTRSVSLLFTVDRTTSWIGYSIDGQMNVTVARKTIPLTLSGLSDGSHSLIVYANDTRGDTGCSDPLCFNVDATPPIVTIDPLTSQRNKFRLIDRDSIHLTITGTFVEANIDRIVVNEWEHAKLDKAAGTYSADISLFHGNNLVNVTAFDLAGNTATATIAYSPVWAPFEEFGVWIGIVAVGIALVPLPLALKRRRLLAPAISAPNLEYVGAGRRFAALLIDQIILSLLIFTLDLVVFPALHLAPSSLALIPASLADITTYLQVVMATNAIYALIELMYYTLMEGSINATVGKLALHVEVAGEDGTSCGFGSAYIRNLMRVVDAVPYVFPYLFGMIIIGNSSKYQRLGDRAAKTIVVKRLQSPLSHSR